MFQGATPLLASSSSLGNYFAGIALICFLLALFTLMQARVDRRRLDTSRRPARTQIGQESREAERAFVATGYQAKLVIGFAILGGLSALGALTYWLLHL